MNQYYTTTKVAKILNISISTLRSWEENGKLVPTLKLASGKRFYTLEQIEYCFKNGMHKNPKI